MSGWEKIATLRNNCNEEIQNIADPLNQFASALSLDSVLLNDWSEELHKLEKDDGIFKRFGSIVQKTSSVKNTRNDGASKAGTADGSSERNDETQRKKSTEKNISKLSLASSSDLSSVESAASEEPSEVGKNNGFFRRVGTLIRRKAIGTNKRTSHEKCDEPEETSKLIGDNENMEIIHEPTSIGESHRSSVVKKLNDEFYEEILYKILHNVWEDAAILEMELLAYLQDVFKMNNERHKEALATAKARKTPVFRLSIEVIEAKDLRPGDNELTDSFVTMYIQSDPDNCLNTSVKPASVNLKWEQQFFLPLTESLKEEILVVEVWVEKKNSWIKGVQNYKDNRMLGRACIPLKTIPVMGQSTWFNLENKAKTAYQGVVKLRFSFSTDDNRQMAAQQHGHLLKILLLYELENTKIAPFWWAGKFSSESETILTLHSAQSGLSTVDLECVRWSVYADVHVSHPLSYALFDSILDKLSKSENFTRTGDEFIFVSTNPLSTIVITEPREDIQLFWEATIKLLPSCFSVMEKLQILENKDYKSLKAVTHVLKIVSKLSTLELPKPKDLMHPVQHHSWLGRSDPEPGYSLRDAIDDAVQSGATAWFRKVRKDFGDLDGSDVSRLQCIVKILQMALSNLEETTEYETLFEIILNYKYTSALYITYESELVTLIEPVVTAICCNFQPVTYINHSSNSQESNKNEINTGTSLFEVFMLIKRFVMRGKALLTDKTVFQIEVFHQWFFMGVNHWLDIAMFKAKSRIEKAIELDQLLPVDEAVIHSSSAVDTFAIFYQIQVFWQKLNWPDTGEAITFFWKIVYDICNCCDFYAKTLSAKIDDDHNLDNTIFGVTREWCMAINNIEYIYKNLRPFVRDLGTEDIIAKLADVQCPVAAERCQDTLENVVKGALDIEKDRILLMIERKIDKMAETLKKFLNECAEVQQQDSRSMDCLMMYLRNSLETLSGNLDEHNFDLMLEAMWKNIETMFENIIGTNSGRSRLPMFYANLQTTLKAMVANFRLSKHKGDHENLDRIEKLLQLQASQTSELIHLYYKERMAEQNAMEDKPFGQLTIQCCFRNNVLEMEILSARNLLPSNTTGTRDAFVKLQFFPEERFKNVLVPKTNAKTSTLFPLFEERFKFKLSDEQRAIKDAVIMFSVKDKDTFGRENKFVGECFIAFSEIFESTETLDNVTQMHLSLNRPRKLDSEYLKALELRQSDKQARIFLKNTLKKISTTIKNK